MQTENQTGLIYSRISACLSEVQAVGKDHKNQQQGYNFRSIDDFYDAMQPVLARNKVFVAPQILDHTREERTTKSGGVLMTTITKVRFKIFTEDGSFVEADALGEGADSGDKSANKAAAQAMKYLFMQVFSVRVNGENFDAERDHHDYAPPKPKAAPTQSKPVTKSADVLPSKATETTRSWMIKQFPDPERAKNYAVANSIISDIETLNDWPLDRVPTSKPEMLKLLSDIDVKDNYEPKDDELPVELHDAVITLTRRGSKRVDYLQKPDTIGSLWDALKGGDEDARKRLFGVANGWQPEPYINAEGKKFPITPEDAECRVNLDLFLDWHKHRHGGSGQ